MKLFPVSFSDLDNNKFGNNEEITCPKNKRASTTAKKETSQNLIILWLALIQM